MTVTEATRGPDEPGWGRNKLRIRCLGHRSAVASVPDYGSMRCLHHTGNKPSVREVRSFSTPVRWKYRSAHTTGFQSSPICFSVRGLHFRFHYRDVDSAFYQTLHQSPLRSRRFTVRLHDESDRWRGVCPRGHRLWEPTNHHFWCQKCARLDGADGVFYELRNRTNGDLVKRDELRLETRAGQFEPTEGST